MSVVYSIQAAVINQKEERSITRRWGNGEIKVYQELNLRERAAKVEIIENILELERSKK